MSIKNGVFDMIGKTVKEVIINDECTDYPNFHLFIVFDDQAAYEFYGENHLHSANGLFSELEYAKAFKSCRTIKRYYKDKEGKNKIEDVLTKPC